MLTATGIGSGLDIESLVSQLVAAERSPVETRLIRQESSLTAELSAFGSFKGALSTFQTALTDLNKISTFGQRTATSSDEEIITVSADSTAQPGSYDLTVTQLAKAHSLASGSYTSLADTVGTGTLTIRFGTTDYTPPDPGPESYNSFIVNPEKGVANITIDNTNNTLEGVRDAVNAADIGVTAVIVNDGTGYRLLLSSEDTGAASSLEISVTDTGDSNNTDASGLSALAFNASATNLEQTVAGQDAVFTVNGLTINSGENTADTVIDGVEINLQDITTATPVTIDIAEDRESVKQAITDFVEGYNSFVSAVNSLTDYDAANNIAAPLQGDFSARSILSQLRQVVSSEVSGFNGTFNSLGALGITTQIDGTLNVDSTKLDQALETDFETIVGLFAAVGLPSDSGVEFVTSTEETEVGSYAVEITQLATQGLLVGAATGFPLVIDADNDDFTVQVDGVSTGGLSLTQGTYADGASLAAELQARINGASALVSAGVQVSVAYNVDHFEITSTRYGSASKVEITSVDTNTAAELGLSVATGTDGVDVAGTIGGLAATGAGQLLSGTAGTATEGLQLLINGGAIGSRGTVDFSRGISYQLNSLITSFLETEGILDARTTGIQGRIEDIEDQREALDRRMESLEARYRRQFNALDGLLAQLQSTSNFLTQQLANLPKPGALVNSDN